MPEEPLEDGWYLWDLGYSFSCPGLAELRDGKLYGYGCSESLGDVKGCKAVAKFPGPPEEV
jgi:hypothetical protein